MGLYGDRVLPRIIDVTCGSKKVEPLRRRVCEDLAGDVVEIGFGSGHNVPFYPATVTRVAAVEPSDLGWKLADKRLRAATVPVERSGLDGQSLPFADIPSTPDCPPGPSAPSPTSPRHCARCAACSSPGRRCTFSSTGWLLAGALQAGGYSASRHDVSDLGALTAQHPWVILAASGIAGALTILFALLVLRPSLAGPGRGTALGAWLVAASLMGLDNLSDAFFRLDCRAADRGCTSAVAMSSWHGTIHVVVARISATYGHRPPVHRDRDARAPRPCPGPALRRRNRRLGDGASSIFVKFHPSPLPV